MTHQRPAKITKSINDDGNISLKQLIDFSKTAEKLLEENNETDAAFYFGQLHDWLKSNPHIGLNTKCEKILGL
jgi:hypothetical protein